MMSLLSYLLSGWRPSVTVTDTVCYPVPASAAAVICRIHCHCGLGTCVYSFTYFAWFCLHSACIICHN